MEEVAYYKGYTDGLEVGIDNLKEILERAKTLDDVLVNYNEMCTEYYLAFQKLNDLKELQPNQSE